MKRFHVHAHVQDLPASIAFYSKLFAAQPTRTESDYAKWMLEDPRINFAISTRGSQVGVDHLGIQTDTEAELVELKAHAAAADMTLLDEGQTTCCYARSDKYWLTDPQGIAWEQFHTLGDIPVFSESKDAALVKAPTPTPTPVPAAACCAPSTAPAQSARSSATGKPLGIPIKAGPTPSCC